MAEKKKTLDLGNILAVACAVALIILSGSLIAYTQQNANLKDANNQIAVLQSKLATPKLVAVGLQYIDNRSNPDAPFLQVTGYVVNAGTAEANNCTFHVTASQNGNVTTFDSSVPISAVEPGGSEQINLQFPYTGQALMEYNGYLTWSN